MCGLSFIYNISDLAVSEIWILTDKPIIHSTFIELAIYRQQYQQEYSSPFSTAFGSAPYSSTVGPFSCRPSRELNCGRPCEGSYKQSCGSGKPHGPYIN
ncbi:hypothetical protein TNCV_3100481 [Trichonephila clavipes]|nr:hypothetical protein TNCV_3100481 [Trichonephila clavipes]